MYKRIFISIVILLNLFINISNADTTNLYNYISNESNSEEEVINDEREELSSSLSQLNSSATVKSMSTIAEANLSLNNILCIILIAIGILLVLLAIAILIRLQK